MEKYKPEELSEIGEYNNTKDSYYDKCLQLIEKIVKNAVTYIANNLKTETVIVENIEDESFEEKIDEQVKVLSEEQEVPAIKITVYEKYRQCNARCLIRSRLEAGAHRTHARGHGV